MARRDIHTTAGDAQRRVAGRRDARSTSPVPERDAGDIRFPVAANHRDVDLGRFIDATTTSSVAAPGAPIAAPPPRARGLPMAVLSTPDEAGPAFYLVTAIDTWGRLADMTPTRAMKWGPGRKISFTADLAAGFIVIKPGGLHHVTNQGHLRLPLHLRRRLALRPGDRLLLAIMAHLGLITAYPMSTVDRMIHAHHAASSRSEAIS